MNRLPGMEPPLEPFVPDKIISGGQTGVDRGALDAAIELGIVHGGFCPAGRLAEDGMIPEQYDLTEIRSRHYPDRTEKNIVESDATLVLFEDVLRGGTALTRRLCRRLHVPYEAIDLRRDDALHALHDWLHHVRPSVLNVAGPRESHSPGIAETARQLLIATFRVGWLDRVSGQ
ncbi:MAG: putative molybdenum carrier protein [Planctomycetota bacterium]